MPTLTDIQTRFILHWGEMGTRWGINRSVAQIHALLYLSPEPLHAEAIMDALSIARSNVSNSLKELQSWGIVRVVHVLGDRRDHFESLSDVWEMFQIIMDERKRREIDPTLRMLEECLEGADESDTFARERLESMNGFLKDFSTWYGHVRRLPHGGLRKFIKMGSKLARLLEK